MERKEIVKKILNMFVTVITAVVTTLGTTSCVVDVHPPASLTPVYAN